mmetsp:Transcript_55214/g.151990  ORF Transcript_55214/g.151990 Transcript_55214/m.151990 type:complete len:255 (+) Transcript_55214:627-1391(+)
MNLVPSLPEPRPAVRTWPWSVTNGGLTCVASAAAIAKMSSLAVPGSGSPLAFLAAAISASYRASSSSIFSSAAARASTLAAAIITRALASRASSITSLSTVTIRASSAIESSLGLIPGPSKSLTKVLRASSTSSALTIRAEAEAEAEPAPAEAEAPSVPSVSMASDDPPSAPSVAPAAALLVTALAWAESSDSSFAGALGLRAPILAAGGRIGCAKVSRRRRHGAAHTGHSVTGEPSLVTSLISRVSTFVTAMW